MNPGSGNGCAAMGFAVHVPGVVGDVDRLQRPPGALVILMQYPNVLVVALLFEVVVLHQTHSEEEAHW